MAFDDVSRNAPEEQIAAFAPRRILIVCPDFYPNVGGYSNALTSFVLALSEDPQLKVKAITWAPLAGQSELTRDNLLVERFRRLPEFRYSIILDQIRFGFYLRRKIRTESYWFVLFETFENPISLLLCLWRFPYKRHVAIRIHGSTETEVFQYGKGLMNRINRRLQKYLAGIVPNIFATTPYYKQFFVEKILEGDILASFKNFHTIPNCISGRRSCAGGRVSSGDTTFLCLGRLNTVGYNQKNFELVAQALYLVKKEHPDIFGKMKVYFAGKGERRVDLESVLRHLGIADRCEALESLPNEDVQSLQRSASATILVSRYEGHSMFALEALANGSPLIISKNTGLSQMVEDGENGFLVDYDDPFDLANAMYRIVFSDLSKMSEASRRLYAERFGPQKVVQKFLTCIELCLASRK